MVTGVALIACRCTVNHILTILFRTSESVKSLIIAMSSSINNNDKQRNRRQFLNTYLVLYGEIGFHLHETHESFHVALVRAVQQRIVALRILQSR